MNIDVASIVERARLSAQRPAGAEAPGDDARRRLERVAQEFESLLLVQMLRDMRSSGSWDDDGDKETLGAESMFETLDVELASHLAKVQGLGLSKQLLETFDRRNAVATAPVEIGSLVGSPEASAVTLSPEPLAQRPSSAAGVTSEFGWRRDPITGENTFHRGVDLRAAYGQDVQATGHGKVVYSGDQGGYGTTVLIEHADGTRTRYAHLSVALVAQGAQVAPGQPIGRVGSSGRATGPHLHFEVLGADGRPLDPRIAGNLGNSGH